MMMDLIKKSFIFFLFCMGFNHPVFLAYAQDIEPNDLIPIRPFHKVGPILRDVTHNTITIMGQGKADKKSLLESLPLSFLNSNAPANQTTPMGIIQASPVAEIGHDALLELNQFMTFQMHHTSPYYVGTATLKGLSENTPYDLQIGYARVPTQLLGHPDQLGPHHFDWTNTHPLRIKTLNPDHMNEDGSFAIIFGSCRRICNLDILTYHWTKKGDKTFKAIREYIAQGGILKPNAIIMLGDQVYVDGAAPLDTAKTEKEYTRLHCKAFSQPHVRALMGEESIPTYMVCDDHEFINDADAEWMAYHEGRYNAAWRSYSLYQRPFGLDTPDRWFSVSNGLEMFFFDTRTQRFPSLNQIISPEQMLAAKNWASDPVRANRIKVFFSSVPFFMLSSDDSWAGYPDQRYELMQHIMEHDIRYIMFATGDAHCHNQARYKLYTPDGSQYMGREFLEVLVSGFFAVSHNKAPLLVNETPIKVEEEGFLARSEPLQPTLTNSRLYSYIFGNHNTHDVTVRVLNHKNTLLREETHTLT